MFPLTLLFVTLIFPYTNILSQWTLQNYDTNFTLTNINFLDQNIGFACGEKYYPATNSGRGVIYKTVNGGDNWNIAFNDTNFDIKGTCFYDSDTCIAYGGYYLSQSKIIKTTNGGINWFYVTSFEITGLVNSIKYFGNLAYAACATGIFRSTNNGSNWLRILPEFGEYGGSYFINAQTGWCSYDYGNLYKTTNAGINWQLTNLPGYIYAHEIFFTDINNGYVILDTTSFVSKILKTTNGGASWSVMNPGVTNHFWSIYFVNNNTGYISGSGGNIIKTTDAGASWASSFTGGFNETFRNVYFFDPYKGFTCGGKSIILKTINGGFIGITPISTDIPNSFMLSQNYPNPFNPNTKIKFDIPQPTFVKLIVYDML
ncbi:MAG: hypothetical protein ABI543_09570 [Ignavibacteria bacterium]